MEYKLVKDLSDVIPESLPKDWYSTSYCTNVGGGKCKLWQINDRGTETFTISTESEESTAVAIYSGKRKKNMIVHKYRHHVLTQKGFNEIQALLVRVSL